MLISLQALRGIFAIFIFLNHAAGFDAGGDVGVAFFFILSGFVLCNGYESRICERQISFRRFLTRRVTKIYPLHLLCFAAAVVLQLRIVDFSLFRIWMLNLLLLQSWIPNPDVYFSANAVSWFLSDILFCYAVFPFIVRYVRSRRMPELLRFAVVLLAVYFAGVFLLPDRFSNPIVYVNPLSRVFDFIIGIILWQLWHDYGKTQLSARAESMSFTSKSAVEISSAALLAATFFVYPHVPANIATASLWWLPAIVIISVFTVMDKAGGAVTRLLQNKWLLRFGDISFAFYMMHYLVIRYAEIAYDNLGWPLSPWTFMPFCFIVTVCSSYLVYRYYEKPVENLLRHRTKGIKKTA